MFVRRRLLHNACKQRPVRTQRADVSRAVTSCRVLSVAAKSVRVLFSSAADWEVDTPWQCPGGPPSVDISCAGTVGVSVLKRDGFNMS
ncbi:hypothetical protein LSAT2_022513 [Lamellibrachia satsuma]|nr:hypothetical protein LSAT2_022513 [Lamellibrachia satsuma]